MEETGAGTCVRSPGPVTHELRVLDSAVDVLLFPVFTVISSLLLRSASGKIRKGRWEAKWLEVGGPFLFQPEQLRFILF